MDEKLRLPTQDLCLHFFSTTDELTKTCVNSLPCMQTVVCRFWQQLRRHSYVTPTSYLEVISLFKTLLTQKRQDVIAN